MKPATLIGGAVLLIGLGSFGALAWALRKIIVVDRAVDAGDVAVTAVFAVFGAFCVAVGWLLLRDRPVEDSVSPPAERRARRVTLSQGCATLGVLFLMLSVLLPERWYPVVLLFSGLAFLAVSHVLTPCEERLASLRRARASVRQL